jgi:hypothetical protein
MTCVVITISASCSLEAVEEVLWDAFRRAVNALAQDQTVVLLVDDEVLAGDGDPAASAVAAGALGLARALAMEGVRPGWRINVLAAPADAPREDADAWVARLAEPHGVSGTLVRLGARHHGKLPL